MEVHLSFKHLISRPLCRFPFPKFNCDRKFSKINQKRAKSPKRKAQRKKNKIKTCLQRTCSLAPHTKEGGSPLTKKIAVENN